MSKIYHLHNSAEHFVTVNFRYKSGIVPENGITSLNFEPGGHYDFGIEPDYGDTVYATVIGGHWQSINGPLVMGNGNLDKPAGDYWVVG